MRNFKTNLASQIQTLVERRKARRGWTDRWRTWRGTSMPIRTSQAIRMLSAGDEWIQRRPHRVEAFRFGMVIMASMLFGLGSGHSLISEMAGICRMFGLCGLAFYFSLVPVAYYRDQNRARLLRYAAERRLSEERPLRADRPKAPNNDVLLNRVIA